jgi:DNA transformation protein
MHSKKDDTFKEFIIDQLSSPGTVVSRAMFGGYGLYREQVFFGIIHKGRVYFKTDPSTQPAYRERGMKPFRPSVKQTLKNYYEVPAEVVEDAEELLLWSEQAVRAGRPQTDPKARC